jgi:hypothetical protein
MISVIQEGPKSSKVVFRKTREQGEIRRGQWKAGNARELREG